MGIGMSDVSNMHRKRRLKQKIFSRAFLLEFIVLILTVVLFVLLVESYWDSPFSSKGRFGGHLGSLRDKIEQLRLVGLSPNQACKVPRLDPESKPQPDVACKRVKPLPRSCKIATELFFSEPTDTCADQDTHEICEIKDRGKPFVKCSSAICKSSIILGLVDASQGILKWTKVTDIVDLEAHIQSLVEQPPEKPHYGFCFIKCSLEEEEEEEVVIEEKEVVDEEDQKLFGGMLAEMEEMEKESNVYYVYQDSFAEAQGDNRAKQLLMLPPQVDISDLPNTKRSGMVNINLILIDSVSHSHFLRSMPATIQALKRVKKEQTGHVFSYNLLQALKGRTYETQQALFSGEIYNPARPFGVQDMPPEPVHSEVLLKRYKRAGYETMWLEDLCWTWEWGIVKSLLAHSPKDKTHVRWEKLQDALRLADIDRYDMTIASCEILKANGHKDMFHGPNAICYNGKYQHGYILSYLADLQKQLNKVGKPFFHYTEINVAHDDHGRRIQTLDEDLATYIQSISTQDDMMTILFADHGNAYGDYFRKSDEARVETYHPTLTILASKNIPQILGEKQMRALTVNQDRLVSIVDVHYMLQTLAPGGSVKLKTEHAQYDLDPEGLLTFVDPNRTCNSIPRIQPNLCICEAFDSYVANDTRQVMMAEFALGEINNAIQKQFRDAHPEAETGFGACQRLVPTWFGNVQESYFRDSVTTKLDLHVPAGNNASQSEEVFFVIIQTSLSRTTLMTLLSYERMTSYSQYEACADEGVNTKLCVCSLDKPISRPDYKQIPSWHASYPLVFGSRSTRQNVNHCLFIYERRTKSGITLEASLECTKTYFKLAISADVLMNVHTSLPMPCQFILNPGEITFLIMFMQEKPTEEWSVEYSVNYEQIL